MRTQPAARQAFARMVCIERYGTELLFLAQCGAVSLAGAVQSATELPCLFYFGSRFGFLAQWLLLHYKLGSPAGDTAVGRAPRVAVSSPSQVTREAEGSEAIEGFRPLLSCFYDLAVPLGYVFTCAA